MGGASDIAGYLERARGQAAAALHHLRQRRRRQEHADRPPAAREPQPVRRPAVRAGARQPAPRHPGRGGRLRAAARRPRRRARAGHHHRRRLPLLQHRPAQLHRRRLPGPRAVHPQHGHRRLDRGPGRGAGRRAQGPADADSPAQLHRRAFRHSPRRAGGEQDGPGAATRATCSSRSRHDYRALAATLGIASVQRDPAVRPGRRQRRSTRSARMPWYEGPALLEHLDTVDARRRREGATGAFRMPVQWVCRPSQDFRGFAGQDRRRPVAGRRRGRSACRRASARG